MMTTVDSLSGFKMTGDAGHSGADLVPDDGQKRAEDLNPLRRLVDWLRRGNAADRKAARDLAEMIDRLSKMPPHLLDDIGVIAVPRIATSHEALIMPCEPVLTGRPHRAETPATPVSFYLSERFASK
ncbi:hypothetical protein GC209_18220 [bacterium]|nr:hypothetical protein [bacterium]